MQKRLPNIWFFNPTCEYAIANGNASWQPNRILQKMEEDLDTLPLFFANEDDFVLVRKMPSEDYLESLKAVKIKMPGFIPLKEALSKPGFIIEQKNKLVPWGWSPAVHRLLEPLKNSCSPEFKNSPVSHWENNYRELYSKKFAVSVLDELLHELTSDFILPRNMMPEICVTKEDFQSAIDRWGKVMVKAPWSSSGRGLQPVTKNPLHPKVWEKLLGIVKEQGYAITEPYMDKIFDMAFQFEIKKGRISFIGESYFKADKKGQYQGNYLGGLPDETDKKLAAFIDKSRNIMIEPLIKITEKSKLVKDYEGNFGVDTLIYLDENNQFRINPFLEINVRLNMGLLAHKLNTLLSHGKKGMFKMYYKPGETFGDFKKEMEAKHPLRISESKIDSGFFALTGADQDERFGAYILVK